MIVGKHQRKLGSVEAVVLSLTAKGLTSGEISAHLAEIYGASVSKDTISRITGRVVEEMNEWMSRPLDSGRFPLIEANPVPRGFRCPGMRGTRHHRRSSAVTSS